jgi:hypothetical protein
MTISNRLRKAPVVVDSPNSGKRWYHVSEVLQFAVGVLTLLVLGLYTWFSSQQVTESDTANKIARQALGEANKPYVMFSSLAPHLTRDKNGMHKQAGLTFTNYGNTPALNPIFYLCTPIIKETQGNPTYKCDVSEPPSKVNALGPKQPTTFAGPIIAQSDLDASKDERKFIYVFGFFEYNDKIDVDPYGNIKRRVTSFCARIVQPTVETLNSASSQVPNLASSQVPNLANNPGQPGNGAPPDAANLLEPQFIGLGCQGYNYCIDDDCPELPK